MRKGDVDLWARDEVHFQQHGSRCRMCGFRRSQGFRFSGMLRRAKV